MEQLLRKLTNKKLKIIEFERKELEIKYTVYIFRENEKYVIEELGETEDGGRAQAILRCSTKEDLLRNLKEYLKVIEKNRIAYNYFLKNKKRPHH
ncbi:MAG: hypothetical protein MJH09_10190 [Cetobacterium sp.]|nr:hypothetical protein [Cetobacterium sp.]